MSEIRTFAVEVNGLERLLSLDIGASVPETAQIDQKVIDGVLRKVRGIAYDELIKAYEQDFEESVNAKGYLEVFVDDFEQSRDWHMMMRHEEITMKAEVLILEIMDAVLEVIVKNGGKIECVA